MRIKCCNCGKVVSTEVSDSTIIAAWVECADCISQDSTQEYLGSRINKPSSSIQSKSNTKVNTVPIRCWWLGKDIVGCLIRLGWVATVSGDLVKEDKVIPSRTIINSTGGKDLANELAENAYYLDLIEYKNLNR